MPFGILEDRKLPHVPGTILLHDERAGPESIAQGLKHGKGQNSNMILSPQPSEDPNDPLNWPHWHKDLQLAILFFGATIFAATFGPLLVPGTVVISIELDVSIPAVAQLGGYQLLVVGATGPFVCAVSRKFGKRPVFLFSGMMGIIGTIIGGFANDYHLLLVGRIVQGFATSAFESIVVTVIGDMYFVHERGIRISLLTLALGAISSLVSVITGPITTNLGWKYCFWILLPFCCVQFILMILFCPESTYNREAIYDIDTNVYENLGELVALERGHVNAHQTGGSPGNGKAFEKVAAGSYTSPSAPTTSPRKPFFERLAPINQVIYAEQNLGLLILAPFLVFGNIAALWYIVMSGLIVGWYVGISFIMAQWFSQPPYNYTAADVGFLWAGPALGALAASLFMSMISDPLVKFCIQRNRGIYEPEFRLFPMIFCLVFTVLGLSLYGYGLQQYWSPPLTAIVHAAMLFGILIGSIASSAYLLDGFRSISNEVFIAAMAFKNFLFYSLSYYVNNWILVGGPMQMFGVFAGISAFFIGLTVPMYIWGKQYRSFWARHNLMTWVGFKSHMEAVGSH